MRSSRAAAELGVGMTAADLGDSVLDELSIDDNTEARRYEASIGPRVIGFIDYGTEPGHLRLIHTEVDPAFEGQGVGSRLVAGALADIRRRRLSIVPICPFVGEYVRRHPEEADLVAA